MGMTDELYAKGRNDCATNQYGVHALVQKSCFRSVSAMRLWMYFDGNFSGTTTNSTREGLKGAQRQRK